MAKRNLKAGFYKNANGEIFLVSHAKAGLIGIENQFEEMENFAVANTLPNDFEFLHHKWDHPKVQSAAKAIGRV